MSKNKETAEMGTKERYVEAKSEWLAHCKECPICDAREGTAFGCEEGDELLATMDSARVSAFES